jgi:hypothetical protein
MPPEKGSKSSNTRHNLSSLSVQPNPPFPTVHKTQTQQMMNINTVFFYSMKFLFMKILLIVFFYLFSHIYLSLSLSLSLNSEWMSSQTRMHTHVHIYMQLHCWKRSMLSIRRATNQPPSHTHKHTHIKRQKEQGFSLIEIHLFFLLCLTPVLPITQWASTQTHFI